MFVNCWDAVDRVSKDIVISTSSINFAFSEGLPILVSDIPKLSIFSAKMPYKSVSDAIFFENCVTCWERRT